MEPTLVRIGVMDSRRPQVVVSVAARHLRTWDRLRRALGRTAAVTGVGLLLGNVALVVVPVPHVHLCLFPISLILGPIVGVAAWRDRVLLAASALACPRCGGVADVPADLPGWPARFNCEHCGIMVELNLAR
jgi:hypothetical protein